MIVQYKFYYIYICLYLLRFNLKIETLNSNLYDKLIVLNLIRLI